MCVISHLKVSWVCEICWLQKLLFFTFLRINLKNLDSHAVCCKSKWTMHCIFLSTVIMSSVCAKTPLTEGAEWRTRFSNRPTQAKPSIVLLSLFQYMKIKYLLNLHQLLQAVICSALTVVYFTEVPLVQSSRGIHSVPESYCGLTIAFSVAMLVLGELR